MKVELTVGKVLSIVAIPGALAGAIAGWHLVGWMTPAGHEHDVVQQETVQQAQYEAITAQQQAFRDEWWCDEEEESLDDMLELKDLGDGSAVLEEEIREQKLKLDEVKCHRFDND